MTAGFRRGPERLLHDGPVVSLAVGTFTAPDGTPFERQVVHHPGAVSVVPMVDATTALLVRQYRAAVDAELLEIPAGKLDVAGEGPEATARRELAEEVGRAAGSLELLAEFHNSPGFCDERSWVYLAADLRAVPHDRQGIEEAHLAMEEVDLGQVPAMIADGRLRDAKTIIGLLLALRRAGG